MLKFVLDVGVGRKVVDFLRNSGYEVISILDEDPSMSDISILAIAEQAEAMVVTMDKDFGELVFRGNRSHKGVLLLRLEDATGAEKVEVLEYILNHYESELPGNFCVYQNGNLRIRKP